MAFQFPINPVVGQVFNAAAGVSYKWDGAGWVPLASGFLTADEGDIRYVQWSNLYNVGDIHLTMNSTNPASRFGGTWDLISQGRFLIGAAGAGFESGSIGGSNTATITQANLPAVNLTGTADAVDINHTHNYTDNYIDGTTGTPALTTQLPPSVSAAATGHTQTSATMNSNNLHGHSVTVALGGSNQPISTAPQYFAVYVWRRIA